MYVQSNIGVRSCNHYCSGKAVSITYSEYVFVPLVIQHAAYCHLRPDPLCNILPHFLKKKARFSRKKIVIEHKLCV